MYENKNLSLELLKSGLAWHYSYFSDDEEMAQLEVEARSNKVGLWADKKPINPYHWRNAQKRKKNRIGKPKDDSSNKRQNAN